MRRLAHLAGFILVLGIVAGTWLYLPSFAFSTVNTLSPSQPVKLIFIHHSTGEAWLRGDHGGLGIALRDDGYFVSDTNYVWGVMYPPVLPLSRGIAIGSTTDIGDWWTWFRGPDSPQYLAALYQSNARLSSYPRSATDPGGPNEIVVFMSGFLNSRLAGSAGDAVPAIADDPLKGEPCGGRDFTVANAKGIYDDLLGYFAAHQEKLFVVIVAPPVTSPATPGGRALADWLVDHWLQDAGYAFPNVFVFDYYTVLTSNGGGAEVNDLGATAGNHHRVWDGVVQHVTTHGADHLAYPGPRGNNHPNRTGDLKATAEFVPLLNVAYNEWRGNSGGDTTPPMTYAPRAASVASGDTARLTYMVIDAQSAGAIVTIRVTRPNGHPVKTLRLGLRSTGVAHRAPYRCRLPRGTYRFAVYARDMAGVAQSRVGANRLVVR